MTFTLLAERLVAPHTAAWDERTKRSKEDINQRNAEKEKKKNVNTNIIDDRTKKEGKKERYLNRGGTLGGSVYCEPVFSRYH